MTDYLWFRAQTESVQARINTAAIIPAFINPPTLKPDDVKKITALWPGAQRNGGGIQSAPFYRVGVIEKDDIVALKLVLFRLNNVRH